MAENTGFVLVDYEGKTRPYVGAETVLFLSPEGEMVPYSEGTAVENVPIAPDFSGGHQLIEAPEGTLVKSAILYKPDTLIPENIRRGRNVAGVDGDFIGDTEEVTVDLYMADGDQIILPSADGKVISKVTVRKPESLVPGNIAEGEDIGGVVGNLAGSGGQEIGTFGNLKYIIPITQTLYHSSYNLYANVTFKRTTTERIHVILYPPTGTTPHTRYWVISTCYGCDFIKGKDKTVTYAHTSGYFYSGTSQPSSQGTGTLHTGNLTELSVKMLLTTGSSSSGAYYPTGTYYGFIIVTDTAHTGPAELLKENNYVISSTIKVVT